MKACLRQLLPLSAREDAVVFRVLNEPRHLGQSARSFPVQPKCSPAQCTEEKVGDEQPASGPVFICAFAHVGGPPGFFVAGSVIRRRGLLRWSTAQQLVNHLGRKTNRGDVRVLEGTARCVNEHAPRQNVVCVFGCRRADSSRVRVARSRLRDHAWRSSRAVSRRRLSTGLDDFRIHWPGDERRYQCQFLPITLRRARRGGRDKMRDRAVDVLSWAPSATSPTSNALL